MIQMFHDSSYILRKSLKFCPRRSLPFPHFMVGKVCAHYNEINIRCQLRKLLLILKQKVKKRTAKHSELGRF